MVRLLPTRGSFLLQMGRVRTFCISGWKARTARKVTDIESHMYQIIT